MSRWLENEVRWAVEQQIKTQTELDRMRDPKWITEECGRRRWKVYEARGALKSARVLLASIEDGERWAEEVARKAREVEDWQRMADAARERLLATEQDGLFGEVPA